MLEAFFLFFLMLCALSMNDLEALRFFLMLLSLHIFLFIMARVQCTADRMKAGVSSEW